MRLRKLSHLAIASLAVATLAVGCASSGGDDEVAPAATNTEFYDGGAMADRGINPDGERGLLETVYFE